MNKKVSVVLIVITLISALVITTIAIKGVTAGGTIDDADEVTLKYVQAQEESTLRMQVSEWKSKFKSTMTLKKYLANEYGSDKTKLNSDNSVTVETKSGNRYKVTESGKVTLID